MRCPSVDRLESVFFNSVNRSSTRADCLAVRRLCKARDDARALEKEINSGRHEKTRQYANSCYSDPYASLQWRTTLVLHALDVLLGTHGVESLGPLDMRDGPPYEYCNAGDPYVTTLIYTRATDTLRIGCWGDIAERHPTW